MYEARTVFAANYDESLPVMKAIGLRQLRRFFDDAGSLNDAVEDAKRESRRFAKRQMTWFRNQPPKAIMIQTQDDKDAFLESLIGIRF